MNTGMAPRHFALSVAKYDEVSSQFSSVFWLNTVFFLKQPSITRKADSTI